MIKGNGFPKTERMTSEKDIKVLFNHGEAAFYFPIKFLYKFKRNTDFKGPKLLLTVPRKAYKHAADRNFIKRLMREAYRKRKHNMVSLADELGLQIDIAFIFVAKEMPDYKSIDLSIKKILKHIEKQMNIENLEYLE